MAPPRPSPRRTTGIAELPLHHGHAPRWLFHRMVDLGRGIMDVLLEEYGSQTILHRLADPFWFQALCCVLGYDWHSSGTTTVTCGCLKQALQPLTHGVAVAGGKGKASRKTPHELHELSTVFDWSEDQLTTVTHASRMSAKVDTTAIQAGYPLYHHVTIADRDGRWIVIQQGINTTDSTARRYHWCGDHVVNFITEPHNGIVGHQVPHAVLNMTAQQSVPSQQIAVDLINDNPRHLQRDFAALRLQPQATLHHWLETPSSVERFAVHRLAMPKRINWTAVKRVYEFQPRNYEELLAQPGIGPATIRGLALVSELIYGAAPSWHDPIKYTFAYGGKDGVPFPVDRPAMDESIHFLRDAITQVNGDNRTKLRALQRLRSLTPETLRQPIGLMG